MRVLTLKISAKKNNKFANLKENHHLCTRIIKLRHSFLNGYGRLRTAFLLEKSN